MVRLDQGVGTHSECHRIDVKTVAYGRPKTPIRSEKDYEELWGRTRVSEVLNRKRNLSINMIR